MKNMETHKYDDIINLPHHASKKHTPMSPLNRAAQFSPFAALSGHGEAIRETERLTDTFIELSENEKEQLDGQIRVIRDNLNHNPEIEVIYFRPDEIKSGGAYVSVCGKVKKIDEYNGQIIFMDGKALRIEHIFSIRGELFRSMDWLDV